MMDGGDELQRSEINGGGETDEKWVRDSSVDYRGRIPLRASTGAWKASLFIIGNGIFHLFPFKNFTFPRASTMVNWGFSLGDCLKIFEHNSLFSFSKNFCE